jgi:hypothetical protein
MLSQIAAVILHLSAANIDPNRPSHDNSPSDIAGTYENLQYEGSAKNDWHFVTIMAHHDDYIWRNRAGVEWTLKPRLVFNGGDLINWSLGFAVGDDCPYHNAQIYSPAHNFMTVERDAFDNVTGVRGPWGELYTRMKNCDGKVVPAAECPGPICGNGIIEAPEACDNGSLNSLEPNQCRPTCELPMCGDAIVDRYEECDIGVFNAVSTLGCSLECRNPN